MSDKERIKHMQDCNWKPAAQYWRELYERSQTDIAKLKKQIAELEK